MFQYVFVGDNILLLDTGESDTPESVIAPYFKEHRLPLDRLTMAVNTHADADHHGGNGNLSKIAPQVLLACGDADREAMKILTGLFAARYNQSIPNMGSAWECFRKHRYGYDAWPGKRGGSMSQCREENPLRSRISMLCACCMFRVTATGISPFITR